MFLEMCAEQRTVQEGRTPVRALHPGGGKQEGRHQGSDSGHRGLEEAGASSGALGSLQLALSTPSPKSGPLLSRAECLLPRPSEPL